MGEHGRPNGYAAALILMHDDVFEAVTTSEVDTLDAIIVLIWAYFERSTNLLFLMMVHVHAHVHSA